MEFHYKSKFNSILILCLIYKSAFGSQRPDSQSPKPQRIVSCSLASDEILLELMPASERHRILSLSSLANHKNYSNIPYLPDKPLESHPHLTSKPCGTDSLESIYALKPDMVLLASYTSPHIRQQLTKMSIPMHIIPSPQDFDEIARGISEISVAIGERARGETLLEAYRIEREAIRAIKVPESLKTRRIIHLFEDGAISGKNTLFDAFTVEVGVVNQARVHGLKGWSKHSVETLMALRPDTVILGTDINSSQEALYKKLTAITGISLIKTLSKNRIIAISEREFGSASHHVLKGLRRFKTELIRIETIP